MSDPTVKETVREGDYWRICFRSLTGTKKIPTPKHIQEEAREIAQGAKVRMGRNSADVSFVAEVLVPQAPARNRARAERLAKRIVEAVEG